MDALRFRTLSFEVYHSVVSSTSLLGVRLDSVTRQEALSRIRAMLGSGGRHHVLTPNSEMLVEAHRNPRFKAVLNATALNIPDSQGVVWLAGLPERVTGVDTVTALCEDLSGEHPVFLLGAGEGIAERAATVLKERNPRLNVVGTYAGSPRADDAAAIVSRINDAKPHLLLVAYGSPLQDLWIAEHLEKLLTVRVAMGVGGTFDFVAGAAKRAPKVFQTLGIEWLWRLMLEPKRWKRIFTAVVVFPWLVIKERRAKA